MIVYKIDVIQELKKIGITSTNAKESKVFGQSTFKKFKEKDTNISIENLNKLCCLLEMQPRDIIKYKETDEDTEMFEKNVLKRLDNHDKR
ncbi:MAG TPA: helix-turn-helix domain-containing protein [Candidatus Scybalomonas excrementigallinarum]|nr:helix-turn-helix domain-containing protein [Candidatus Scybalomonas excrementigallinarum]